MDLEHLYCLPEALAKNLQLGGNFDLGMYKSLQLRAIRCRDGENSFG